MKPRTRRAPVALMAMVLISSCTAGSGQKPPPLGAVPLVRDAANLTLPLDAYSFDDHNYIAVQRAQARLVADCMQRFGVAYSADVAPSALVPGVGFPDFDHPNARRYGLIDAAAAATRGYDPPPDPTATDDKTGAKNDGDGGTALTPQVLFLLDGKTRPEFAGVSTMPADVDGNRLPDDGCAGAAQRRLAGGKAAQSILLPSALGQDTAKLAENDSRVQTAMTAWSACMKRDGYQYRSSREPNNADWPEPPGAAEIATATADVACKQQTNLVGIWFAVESAYQKQTIERHSQQLTDLRTYLDTVAHAATQIVDGAN
jgi:hypothetical protein